MGKSYASRIIGEFLPGGHEMRKWLENADSDDLPMVVSGCVAMDVFFTFVLVWFVEAPAPECGRNCSSEFSSVNR